MDYQCIAPANAYELLNCGGVILVCTVSAERQYNLAPIAWNCPLDYEPLSRLLFVIDPKHQTFKNLEASREFSIALPTYHQKKLVEQTGSVSGAAVDKYTAFAIASFPATDVDARIPEGVAASLDCRVLEIVRISSVAIVAGEVLSAKAIPNAWELRLHHAGKDLFYRPGNRV
ncbi:MAG TPA: flavin reductase family protein [Treponema sp.]|nr:flavin reductase family protein [Treponema sp.]HRS04369.1 flavin reductase family protein [Treponema sp.]HRU28772.1 flavin reductase family protein [Treponema sp.]